MTRRILLALLLVGMVCLTAGCDSSRKVRAHIDPEGALKNPGR